MYETCEHVKYAPCKNIKITFSSFIHPQNELYDTVKLKSDWNEDERDREMLNGQK